MEELQRQTQNPVSKLISVPFQNNSNFPGGAGEPASGCAEHTAVVPFRISSQWNLITMHNAGDLSARAISR